MTIDKLKNELLKEIKKTGYPTELQVASKFLKKKWSIEENTYYIDKDENKGREIDLITHQNIVTKEHEGILIWTYLIIEIKKSNKPWIIFTTKRRVLEVGGYSSLTYSHNVKDVLNYAEINKGLPALFCKRIGRSVYEGKRGSNTKSRIFEAISKVTKAAIEKQESMLKYGEDWSEQSHDIVFINPVVIFEGLLFEVYLNEQGEVEINETNYTPYRFNYLSAAYKRDFDDYIIDIVTLDGLDLYLKRQEKWINNMFLSINKNLNSQ